MSDLRELGRSIQRFGGAFQQLAQADTIFAHQRDEELEQNEFEQELETAKLRVGEAFSRHYRNNILQYNPNFDEEFDPEANPDGNPLGYWNSADMNALEVIEAAWDEITFNNPRAKEEASTWLRAYKQDQMTAVAEIARAQIVELGKGQYVANLNTAVNLNDEEMIRELIAARSIADPSYREEARRQGRQAIYNVHVKTLSDALDALEPEVAIATFETWGDEQFQWRGLGDEVQEIEPEHREQLLARQQARLDKRAAQQAQAGEQAASEELQQWSERRANGTASSYDLVNSPEYSNLREHDEPRYQQLLNTALAYERALRAEQRAAERQDAADARAIAAAELEATRELVTAGVQRRINRREDHLSIVSDIEALGPDGEGILSAAQVRTLLDENDAENPDTVAQAATNYLDEKFVDDEATQDAIYANWNRQRRARALDPNLEPWTEDQAQQALRNIAEPARDAAVGAALHSSGQPGLFGQLVRGLGAVAGRPRTPEQDRIRALVDDANNLDDVERYQLEVVQQNRLLGVIDQGAQVEVIRAGLTEESEIRGVFERGYNEEDLSDQRVQRLVQHNVEVAQLVNSHKALWLESPMSKIPYNASYAVAVDDTGLPVFIGANRTYALRVSAARGERDERWHYYDARVGWIAMETLQRTITGRERLRLE